MITCHFQEYSANHLSMSYVLPDLISNHADIERRRPTYSEIRTRCLEQVIAAGSMLLGSKLSDTRGLPFFLQKYMHDIDGN